MGKNNLIILGLVLGIFVFLSGCVEQPTCNSPYILVGSSCCLDTNNNSICDSDDAVAGTGNATPATGNGTQDNVTGGQLPVSGNESANQSVNETQDTEPETGNTTQESGFFCNPPYYEYMSGNCCLDANDNLICDTDEAAPQANASANETGNTTQETGNTTITETAYCGDGTCNANETSADCCKDCGCTSGGVCLANTCTEFKGFVSPSIKIATFCGDGTCSGSENSSNCCTDCGCPITMSCSNNSCTSMMFFQPIYVIPLSPEVKISNRTVTDLAKPRASEYFVTWMEYFSADPDIILYNLQTSKLIHLEQGSSQYFPDVYGKRLVWEDYRRPVQGDNTDIYYYDVVSGTEGFVTSRIEYKWGGAIDGNHIVWTEQDGYNRYNYLFDLGTSTETKLTSSDIYPAGLDVSGNYVVYGWYNCDSGTCHNGIKLYNIATKKTSSIIDTTGDINYDHVRIYGNKVVYISGKDQYSQVNVYDIASKLTTQITSALGDKDYPAIYNNTVVWQDKRKGNWDIYMYDLQKKKETALVNESHDQIYPDVYGNKVVYQDKRDGRNIYMYTLSG